jgi:hypothetical protein
MRKWDRIEKIYATLMYSTEALAILSIAEFIASKDIYIGMIAIILTILTATFHLMLLTYHRTRLILENLKHTE